MQNLFAFFYRYAFIFLFLVLEFISVRLVIRRNENQRAIFLNSSNIISGQLFDRMDRIKKYFGLGKVNESLAKENAALRSQIANIKAELPFKADSIQDSIFHQRFVLLPALVVNNSVELRNNVMTINQGAIHGIQKYATVMESTGIVGFVTDVGSRYSSVMSILNSSARVSVMISRTHYIGNLVWNSNSPILMEVEAIPKHGDVRVGDTVVTSGFSHFPEGLPVGLVTKAQIEPGENFYNIETKLFNDLARTNQVYVIIDLHKNEIDSLNHQSRSK
jgi:rod shape-determining protein MreC